MQTKVIRNVDLNQERFDQIENETKNLTKHSTKFSSIFQYLKVPLMHFGLYQKYIAVQYPHLLAS